ncbi:hypothetical protein [Amycolatopsis sp. H20-H5]|uniref:hypothetical protein n=1 Tax=Amycolatopsis sp. H20-H5 TaxID=3046309 RepID=UPI002DBCF2D8|nr:hypothetical protein [Amycolatopsis sp. H20-H5]MEC3982656.1 hypothetical protein [Amycolatopsis sp. H20-H5]
MDSIDNEIGQCRRYACVGTVMWRGLCGHHWNRWQDGTDLLDLPNDDAAAPPQNVWDAPRGRDASRCV